MMEELDLLKKDWKKSENLFEQLSEGEIYKMLHKKSSSIVKWILIISILEVILWSSISFFYNTDDYLKKIHGEFMMQYFTYLNVFNYIVIAVFIFFFYKNYRAISTITSTKQLMKDILRTRKTVQYYVWYNIIMMAVGVIIGSVMALTLNPKIHQMAANNTGFLCKMIIVCVVIALVGIFLFWLFYRLLYGILLRKLWNNYNELKKIDL